MKAWVISDLHLEFGQRFEARVPPGADVMICAGDILTKGIVPTLEWIGSTVAKHIPVVVVAGNHEFFGASMLSGILEARAFATSRPNIHFLENGTVTLDEVTFVGGTLWTDFRLDGRDPEIAMFNAEYGNADYRMSDYKRIKYSKKPYRKFKPIHAYRKHRETRDYIAAKLAGCRGKVVVVTHHAPSIRSLQEWERSDPFAACYASNLDSFILKTRPALWVHGHVHRRAAYSIGETSIVCNPRGYPGEKTGFDPAFVVDL